MVISTWIQPDSKEHCVLVSDMLRLTVVELTHGMLHPVLAGQTTYLTNAIEKTILVCHVHGLRLPEAACTRDLDASPVHLAAGALNLSDAVSQVAAKRNVRRGGALGATAATSCVRPAIISAGSQRM